MWMEPATKEIPAYHPATDQLSAGNDLLLRFIWTFNKFDDVPAYRGSAGTKTPVESTTTPSVGEISEPERRLRFFCS